MNDVVLVDSTLRDGSHAVAHQFTVGEVTRVAAAVAGAGVRILEVSHGDGLGGSSFNYGFSGTADRSLVEAAARAAGDAEIAVLLLPGIGVADDLRVAKDLGASVARIATHCTEADIAEQHIGLARELGMTTVGFLMMAHMAEPADLLAQAQLMESYGAEVVYCTDSAGALTMDMVRSRVSTLREHLGCAVGVHCHNNLHLAVANTLVAIEEGATWVDGCVRGLGAGAGNMATEGFVAVAERLGIGTGVDLNAIADVAEDVVAPIMHRPQTVDRASLMLGYAGVYSSFLLHAERAAAQFGVPVRDILLELGERKVVGGQEDMIIDVAAELRARA
jgi:4-hydroxy 2-oxovalerate aldolase